MLMRRSASAGDPSLSRLQNRGGDPDRAIVMAFKPIASMADRLSLVTTIKDRVSEINKRLEDQKCTRGRNLDKGKELGGSGCCLHLYCLSSGRQAAHCKRNMLYCSWSNKERNWSCEGVYC